MIFYISTCFTYIIDKFQVRKDFRIILYMPILIHLGHQKTQVIRTLTEMAYFPTARRTSSINQPQPPLHAQIPCIKYCWSDTRPCMAQLKQFTTTRVFLKPILPISPMRSLLTYEPPNTTNHGHEVLRCGGASHATCLMCDRYQPIYHAGYGHFVTRTVRYGQFVTDSSLHDTSLHGHFVT